MKRSGAATLALLVCVCVGVGATAGVASAREVTAKTGTPLSQAARTKLDRELRARVGKKPADIINLWNVHTHEWVVLDATDKATLAQDTADQYFRCYFTNRPTTIDRRLLGVLAQAAVHFAKDRIIVVSGYRHRKYNLMLRKKGREVARESQHSEGHAIDFQLPGVPTAELREFVKSLRVGGVGYYPQSGFVHADTGRVRFWTGR